MAFELVYTSIIAPTSDVRAITHIVRRARISNRVHDLSGILVFDGQRFCQCIEGERDAVLALGRKLATDPRHQQFSVLHEGFGGTQRRFGQWNMAYALDISSQVIEKLAAVRGPQVAELLQLHLPQLDIQPD